ncbi:unnamed protein product [Nyctereutes procyonoides]|uniref:(raccoon dog) hypothetical protein n=1 Tax=Nyctereutes procyonoides TaxID=34880 RepID=A0A811ZJ43_NYCPR|nr:unnamed protein product [Nyctereutes procyonoides]
MMPALGKFCPRGWRERESPPPAQRLSVGAPPPGRRTSAARSSPPPPTAAVSSGGELRRLLPGAADPGCELRARGEGARVPGAGRRGLWAPSPEWLVPGSSKGVVSSSPWGPPYELRPLPARLTGAKARGLSATRCPGPILLKSPGEGGGGRREELLPSAASAVPLAAAGFARPEGAAAATASRTHESRGEERTHAGSRRPQARPAPRPPRLAALTLAAGRSRGASARVASLPARTRPECGVVIVTLRSGGASRRSRSRCGSRCPRLGRAGCRPGGALTSPPCSAPLLPPPSPLHFLCLWSHLLLGEGACAAGRPDSSPAAPPPRLRLPLPPPPSPLPPPPSPCVYNS